MFDRRNNLCHQVAADARQHFPEAVFDVTIPATFDSQKSPSFGKPIYLYDRASKGAKAYERLADHLARKHMKGPLEMNKQRTVLGRGLSARIHHRRHRQNGYD